MSSNEEEGGDKMAIDTDDEKDKPQTSSFPNEGASTSAIASSSSVLHQLCSPGEDGKKEKLVERYEKETNVLSNIRSFQFFWDVSTMLILYVFDGFI